MNKMRVGSQARPTAGDLRSSPVEVRRFESGPAHLPRQWMGDHATLLTLIRKDSGFESQSRRYDNHMPRLGNGI